ncbi:hypothetical protein ROE7235_03633 [Roseibaca ekhonensis]|uniref:DUF6900 domain-containing protein n=2 Tax=Roseinatronobacter ekhonensis TaxID=254356 RepID=A0A3B0MJV1_9RHOB|nr:hypothetical protein ROE7235_03633 [Roseibaca ekhonensis]
MLHLPLVGEDGNAFAILGRASKLLRDHGLDKIVVDQFLAEARSGDYAHLLETCQRWFACDQAPSPDATLEDIAMQHLDIETLETQNSDRLDFHDVSVWSIKAALTESYERGYEKGQHTMPEPSVTESRVTADLRIDLLEQIALTAKTDAERFVAHTSWTTEDPMATLRAFADSSAANALTPKLATAAHDILRRLRIDDTA